PDADAVVTVVGEVELAEHELGVRLHGGQRGLRRQRSLPHDLQVAEVRELHRRVAGDQAGLVDDPELRAVELRALDGELVRGDVQVLLVDADAGLVTEGRAAGAGGVGRVARVRGRQPARGLGVRDGV